MQHRNSFELFELSLSLFEEGCSLALLDMRPMCSVVEASFDSRWSLRRTGRVEKLSMHELAPLVMLWSSAYMLMLRHRRSRFHPSSFQTHANFSRSHLAHMTELRSWDSDSVPIEQLKPINKPFVVCSITASLALLAIMLTLVVGLSVWASMFSLNRQGFNFLSREAQLDLQDAFVNTIQAFFENGFAALQVWEEQVRIDLQDGVLSLAEVSNASAMLRRAWALAKQAQVSLIFGLPTGDGFAYVVNATNRSIDRYEAEGGILVGYSTDYSGNALVNGTSIVYSTLYNATFAPWFIAANENNVAVTEPFVGVAGVAVIAASTSLYADLQPPPFARSRFPLVAPNGPLDPSPRPILGVFSVELGLSAISDSLAALDLNGGKAFIFSAISASMVGFSANETALSRGQLVLRTFEVDDVFVNDTMGFILEDAGIAIDDIDQYRKIQVFENRYVFIEGVEQILSISQLFNDSGTSWILVVAIPKEYYFSQAYYANTVSLIVIFVVILPLTSALAFLVAHFCVSRPSKELAAGMDLMKSLEFSESKLSVSRIREISIMQESFSAMKNALAGFIKFAPIHVVRMLLGSKKAAELGVQSCQATSYFSDIVGFTSISEVTPPPQLILALSEYFEAMTVRLLVLFLGSFKISLSRGRRNKNNYNTIFYLKQVF